MTDIGRERYDRIAGALPDAINARRGIALEDGTILGKRELFCCVLRRLPVGVVRTPLHIVNLLTIEFKWDPQFDQRHDIALPRKNAIVRRRDRLEVAGADGGKADTARSVDVDHVPSGEVALEGARRLLFDIRPRRIGNRGKLAVKIIHTGFLL